MTATAPTANAMARTVLLPVPPDAIAGMLTDIAVNVHDGTCTLAYLDYLVAAKRDLDDTFYDSGLTEAARVQQYDEAVAALLAQLSDPVLEMSPEQALQLASRLADAALEARGCIECACGVVVARAVAVEDGLGGFRHSQECLDEACERAGMAS